MAPISIDASRDPYHVNDGQNTREIYLLKTIQVTVKDVNKNETEYLLEIKFLEKDNADSRENTHSYSHYELVQSDNIDTFMENHLASWLDRGYKTVIDEMIYDQLSEAKNMVTKKMLREGHKIKNVEVL